MVISLVVILLFPMSVNTFASLAQFAGGEGHITLAQPLTIRWQYDSDLTINFTPAIDGERVYLPLAAGILISLGALEGQLFWKTDVGGEISASPIADQRAVYIASELTTENADGKQPGGVLRALGREGGVTLWRRPLFMPLRGTLVANQTTLFGGAKDGRVYAFRKKTGEIQWEVQHDSPFVSQPLIYGSHLFIGNEGGSLFDIDQETGATRWRYQTQGPIRGRPAAVNGIIYFGSADGFVYAVDEVDGRLRWRVRTGAGVQVVANTQGGLLVASLDNFVYFLSFNKGSRLWKRQLPGRLVSQPLTAPDGAFFTPLTGDAGVVLDLRDGKQINNIPIGEDNSTTASPVATGNVLLVTTRHGLIAFSRPDDSIQSKRQ